MLSLVVAPILFSTPSDMTEFNRKGSQSFIAKFRRNDLAKLCVFLCGNLRLIL